MIWEDYDEFGVNKDSHGLPVGTVPTFAWRHCGNPRKPSAGVASSLKKMCVGYLKNTDILHIG
jgi:hypothetical protein